MIIELDNIPKGLELNKWYKVRELNGLHVTDIYVQFLFVWDRDGNRVVDVPFNEPGFLEMEYNTTGYH